MLGVYYPSRTLVGCVFWVKWLRCCWNAPCGLVSWTDSCSCVNCAVGWLCYEGAGRRWTAIMVHWRPRRRSLWRVQPVSCEEQLTTLPRLSVQMSSRWDVVNWLALLHDGPKPFSATCQGRRLLYDPYQGSVSGPASWGLASHRPHAVPQPWRQIDAYASCTLFIMCQNSECHSAFPRLLESKDAFWIIIWDVMLWNTVLFVITVRRVYIAVNQVDILGDPGTDPEGLVGGDRVGSTGIFRLKWCVFDFSWILSGIFLIYGQFELAFTTPNFGGLVPLNSRDLRTCMCT